VSDCARCGSGLGLLHHGPFCDGCAAERLRLAGGAIANVRASAARDAAAAASLAGLVREERAAGGGSARPGPVEQLAIAAVQEEAEATLARQDPSGALDERLLEVGAALVGEDRLAQLLAPRFTDLQVRDIGRGRLPSVAARALPLHDGEDAVFEDAAEVLEPATVTGSTGGYAGTRVRVSKDVSIRLGGYGGESSLKRVEMRATDRGTLTVTTERVVFIGAASTTEFRRSDVLTTATAGPSFLANPSITFHFAKRRPVGFRLGGDGVRLLAAILAAPTAAAPQLAAPQRTTTPAPAASHPGDDCPACRQPYGNSWLFCAHCGARIPS
jgi:hypothetical protein